MLPLFEEVKKEYISSVKPFEDQGFGELAAFLDSYIKQVETLLDLVFAARDGNWVGYLNALQNQVKYFFARDLYNYARLMPVHLAEMRALEKDDPETWKILCDGNFIAAHSKVPFTALFNDQSLEQKIKELKRYGGIVGRSQDEVVLDRLLITAPHLARIAKDYLKGFPRSKSTPERYEHYQLKGEIGVRVQKNYLEIRKKIEMHCRGKCKSKHIVFIRYILFDHR